MAETRISGGAASIVSWLHRQALEGADPGMVKEASRAKKVPRLNFAAGGVLVESVEELPTA